MLEENKDVRLPGVYIKDEDTINEILGALSLYCDDPIYSFRYFNHLKNEIYSKNEFSQINIKLKKKIYKDIKSRLKSSLICKKKANWNYVFNHSTKNVKTKHLIKYKRDRHRLVSWLDLFYTKVEFVDDTDTLIYKVNNVGIFDLNLINKYKEKIKEV